MWSPPSPAFTISVQSRNPVTCVPISSDGSLYCLPVSRLESPSRPCHVCSSFPHPAVPMAIPHTQTHTNGSSVGRRVKSESPFTLTKLDGAQRPSMGLVETQSLAPKCWAEGLSLLTSFAMLMVRRQLPSYMEHGLSEFPKGGKEE
ncbi:hypothetical protein QQF64_011436 [Cirrhinus molitorella]|uniref:Uncharacterized protein n=1 Tax=Cirrhinus molitorella TaxID=172907 RepID=A0ABR3M2W1_9TELE